MRVLIIMLLTILINPFHSFGQSRDKHKELIIFHAGSLSVPLKQIAQEYEKRNPGTKIYLESAGSLVCARKVTELKKPCDILASSDYFVINEMLIPDYASWSIRFATNEIVIAYLEKSKHSKEINSDNWMDILQMKDVIYSRSDPDSDPCGYRTIFTFKLAEKYYRRPGLTEMMSSKNREYIRPKEVDLVALLESNAIDYMFQYKSVAIQHGLKYIELPKEINLSDPAKNSFYSSVSTDVAGSKPGIKMNITGDYINYSITILDNAPQKEEAISFMDFFLSPEGMSIFRKNGQEPLVPLIAEPVMKLPPRLLKYFAKANKN
ncbi:MAG: extracellular solute-binding protein [Bacteroidales bacterium]